MRPLDPDRPIVQANDLACAAFRGDLMARRLTLAALSCYELGEDGRLVARVPVADFLRLFGLTRKSNIYRDLRDAVHRAGAGTSILYQKKGSRDWAMLNLIESAQYLSAQGGGRYVEVFFGDGIKPWVLGLSRNFHSFRLRDIARIPSIYSLRMYEILLHQSHGGEKREVIVALEELKTALYLRYPELDGKIYEKYKSTGDFMRHVVRRAQRELAQTSNLSFELEDSRWGQRIGALTFYVTVAGKAAGSDQGARMTHEEATLVAELGELGYAGDGLKLIRQEGAAFVRATLALTNKIIREAPANSPIHNPGGFFQGLIKQRVAEKIQLADEASKKSDAETPESLARDLVRAFDRETAKRAEEIWDGLGPDDRTLVHVVMRSKLNRFTLARIESEGWGGTGTLYLQNRKDVLLEIHGESFPPHLRDIAAWAEQTGELEGYDPQFKERVLQAARNELSGGAADDDSDAA